ncbi:MAG: cation:proton antiporter [Trueperaceae bacterium]|nr:MAG: cation:proton antiporter [Trueperaceae bacterium]
MEVVWLGLAYVLGIGAKRLGLPTLIGYLVAGFALSALGYEADTILGELAHMGVLLLLFTVGLKLRLRNLLRFEVWGIGLIQLVLVGGLIAVLLLVVGLSVSGATFVAVCLAFSSTVLAAKVLEERRELTSFHGRVAMGLLILQDIVAVAMMAVVGAGRITPWVLLLLALPLLGQLLSRLLEASGHAELLLLYGVALALASAALFELGGLSGELGAIVAGGLLAQSSRSGELSDILWGLKEVYLVAFFIEIGLIGLPSADALLIGVLLLLLVPLKMASLLRLLLLGNLRARSAFLTSLALASHSEFALIAARAGVDAGLIDSDLLATLGIAVAFSYVLAAPLNRVAHALTDRLEPLLVRFETRRDHPDEAPVTLGAARALIIGMGRTGSAAYNTLRAAGEHVVGFDTDPAALELCLKRGQRVLYGDAEDPTLWAQLELGGLDMVLLTLPDLEAKLRAARHARARGFTGTVAASNYLAEEDVLLREAGVSFTFNPLAEAGSRMALLGLESLEPEISKPSRTRASSGSP